MCARVFVNVGKGRVLAEKECPQTRRQKWSSTSVSTWSKNYIIFNLSVVGFVAQADLYKTTNVVYNTRSTFLYLCETDGQ